MEASTVRGLAIVMRTVLPAHKATLASPSHPTSRDPCLPHRGCGVMLPTPLLAHPLGIIPSIQGTIIGAMEGQYRYPHPFRLAHSM